MDEKEYGRLLEKVDQLEKKIDTMRKDMEGKYVTHTEMRPVRTFAYTVMGSALLYLLNLALQAIRTSGG